MALYLGVDGGQSATKVLVGDETGKILGRANGGPCNHVGAAEGRPKLIRVLTETVSEALACADLAFESTKFEAACFGMSGGPADKQAIIAEIIPAEKITVTTDAHTALLGGTAGAPGAVIIAGTGSMALAMDAEGQTARAGGWGYLFGDEGGAFDLVRQALRAALRAEEGWGPETALSASLLTAGSAPDVNDLMHRFYTEEWPRQRIAALAPLVEDAAEGGDAVARGILTEAGGKLASYVVAARDQLFDVGEIVPIVYVGGVFESRSVLAAFRAALEAHAGCGVTAPVHGPEVGALLGAYRLSGLQPTMVG